MNFRPDQIVRYQELFPETAFAPFLRNLLDSFLDGQKPTRKRLDEVRRLRIKMEQETAAMRVMEKQLESEEHQGIMSEAVEKQRLQYIQEHPEHLGHFKAGTISAKGYRTLQLKLKFTSRKQVEDWLQKKMDRI